MTQELLVGMNGTRPGQPSSGATAVRSSGAERWQLSDSGAESYERFQVPSVFEPLARLFLAQLPLRAGDRVLDVACGTGIVGRLAARAVGPRGSVMGVDLNPGMLAVARRQAAAEAAPIEWRQGDAADLPCGSAAVDVVVCQQGLQFFPDKQAALAEMHRVLAPGGTLGLSVWRSLAHSPCNVAVAGAVARHIGEEAARRLHAPFALGQAEELRRLVRATGFHDIEISETEVVRCMLPPQESIPAHLASTPLGPDVAALDEMQRALLLAEIGNLLQPFCNDEGMVMPQGVHILIARK